MLSRAALRSGTFSSLVTLQLKNRPVQCVLAARASSTSIAKHLENWDKAQKVYYGPERDHQNFPIRKRPETAPPVRLGFIPENFFQVFYEKTGVTGPYMFGIGLTTFLLSKELWIVEHGFMEFVTFWIAFYFLQRKIGAGLASTLAETSQEVNNKTWIEPIERTKAQAQAAVTDLESAVQSEEGQKYLYEAKRENVDLQLEAIYRQRLADVHQAVARRLDYQAEVETTQRGFEQQHMSNWIVRNVMKSISPQQEKDSIVKCIQDLKALGAKAQAV